MRTFTSICIFLAFISLASAQTDVVAPTTAAASTTAVTVAAAPTVVVPATPAVTEAVKEQAEWAKVADQVITAVSGLLGTLATIAIGYGVQYIRQRSTLARIAITQGLVDRLEKGAIGIINSEAEKLKQRVGVADDVTNPEVRKTITENAAVKVAENFKESLKELGVTSPHRVEDFVRGRVDKALTPKPQLSVVTNNGTVPIPAVMARS